MMYAVMFALICAFAAFGLADTANYREMIPCINYELLDCGDSSRQWAICQTRTQGVKRILSAQLDIRFQNRYCRRYGTPENFGLTASGRSMWTVGSCYGTFFLCLELDPDAMDGNFETGRDFDTTVSKTSVQHSDDNTEPLEMGHTTIQTTYTSNMEQTVAEHMTALEEDNTTDDTTTEFHNEYIVLDSAMFNTDVGSSGEEYLHVTEGKLQSANNTSSNTSHSEQTIDDGNFYSLDPRLKFWLIFAIVGGGIIIVLLIGIIAYMSMQCHNDDTESSSDVKTPKPFKQRYFRQQKLSTAALVSSESDYCTDVYDFIPADKTKLDESDKSKCENSDKTTCETSDKTKCENCDKSNRENYDKTKCETNDETQCKMPKELNVSSLGGHNNRANHYFILLPHDISSLDPQKEKVQVYHHAIENTYDRLIHIPRTSVSDASTYHHLNFQRDRSDVEQCIDSTLK